MPKLKLVICISIIAVIVFGSTVGILAMNDKLWFQKETTTDAYEFPITQDKTPDKWKEFESTPEMAKVCQVPEDILKNISTQGLIETCLNYPLFGNMFAYDSYLQGLEILINQFNGLQELEKRPDAAKELLKYYKNIDYSKVIDSSDPYYALRIRYFDFYMSQAKVIFKLTSDERAELLESCSQAVSTKSQKYSDNYSIDSTIYLAASIMRIDDKGFNDLISDSEYTNYLEYGRVPEELAKIILSKLS